jgi:hypothetical protein
MYAIGDGVSSQTGEPHQDALGEDDQDTPHPWSTQMRNADDRVAVIAPRVPVIDCHRFRQWLAALAAVIFREGTHLASPDRSPKT